MMKRLKYYIQEKLENIGISFVSEIAQVNTYDNSLSYFPWNKYKLCIYSEDHLPAHFHIISRQENFDIRIDCFTGDLVSLHKYGNRKRGSNFTDIVKDVKKWLDEPTADNNLPGLSNRDMVRVHWNANNPEQKIIK